MTTGFSRAIANGPDLGDTVRHAGALRICKLGTEREKISIPGQSPGDGQRAAPKPTNHA